MSREKTNYPFVCGEERKRINHSLVSCHFLLSSHPIPLFSKWVLCEVQTKKIILNVILSLRSERFMRLTFERTVCRAWKLELNTCERGKISFSCSHSDIYSIKLIFVFGNFPVRIGTNLENNFFNWNRRKLVVKLLLTIKVSFVHSRNMFQKRFVANTYNFYWKGIPTLICKGIEHRFPSRASRPTKRKYIYRSQVG